MEASVTLQAAGRATASSAVHAVDLAFPERDPAAFKKPYLVFLADAPNQQLAKTAFGVRDWMGNEVVGQVRLPGCGVDLGAPDLSFTGAVEKGAQSLLIGVAPVGGGMPEAWTPSLLQALEAGLDIVSGLHTKLSDVAEIESCARRLGRVLHDVRHTRTPHHIATGRKRSGQRLLTVGTDCALGKKYTALAITKAITDRGVPADFRATGQTGIMIAGSGVAIDAVVADFVSGAAEALSPDADPNHWDVIEGQGSLFHPAYAGVSLGLLHGSQADALVLCHDPLRTTLHSFPDYPVVPIEVAIERNLEAARLTNPKVRMVGISLNTSSLDPDHANELIAGTAAQYGVPCFDPMRSSLKPLLERILKP